MQSRGPPGIYRQRPGQQSPGAQIFACRAYAEAGPVPTVMEPPIRLTLRDKAVLAGLYLSKFDSAGLARLGFSGFLQAFNVIGAALGVRPASVKNYRDEFDPLFQNERKGWHKRRMRGYCSAVLDSFGGLNLDDSTDLLKRVIYKERDLDLLAEEADEKSGADCSFAKRLMTGQAAEQYFRSTYGGIAQFGGLHIEDTTRLGCGFDFRLPTPDAFYAVEVKGMSEPRGPVTLTSKEYSVATILRARFFLFVVKNFKEVPFHEIHQDPTMGRLAFVRVEQKVTQVSWTATL